MKKEKKYFHAIKIVEENCTGCTRCVRVCPTEALRVRNEVVILDDSRCIDCGRCVAACPYDAIQTFADNLSIIEQKKYKVAIVSTAYAGQFPENIGYKTALKALLHIGFDEVAEESMVTEIMGKMIREYLRKNPQTRPVLSSNCPSVVRLIQVRFPSLLSHIYLNEAPMSVLAMYLRKKIAVEKKISENDIGIYLIVPCVAQVTAVHQPEGTYRHLQDGAIPIRDVYQKVMSKMEEIAKDKNDIKVYPKGLSWALSGMEAEEINDGTIKTLAVSGIDNVIKILAKLENGQLEKYDFIVLNSCENGCVGGVLNIEHPSIAASRIRRILRTGKSDKVDDKFFMEMYRKGNFKVRPLEPRPIMQLADDIKVALEKMSKIREITEQLPGLDCSACGSPTCKALAEDIVAGKADIKDCVVLLKREKVKK